MQHSTRIDIDPAHHITVDWTVTGYNVEREQWQVNARCRLWRSTPLRSGVKLAVKPLTPEVDIDASGRSLEHVLAQLMREAHARCLVALGI